MLVTEEQAAAMACCGQTTFINLMRNDGKEDTLTPLCCMGSTCMAWRWKNNSRFVTTEGPDGAVRTVMGDPKTGYCGLAGRPE